MSELENKPGSFVGGGDDEETDEFEVIQQEMAEHEDEEAAAGRPRAAAAAAYAAAAAAQKSAAASECGTADMADVGDALDGGKSMYSSVSATPSQNLFESVYSFPPFANNDNVEKLVNLLRDEQTKNHTVLEQIVKMVTDLTKERNDNTDLRGQNVALKAMLQQEQSKAAALSTEAESVAMHMSSAVEKLTLHEAKLASLTRGCDDLSERVDALIGEKAALEARLLGVAGAQAASDAALEAARTALTAKEAELATQAEIVNVLQEENAELVKLVDENRRSYRRNLDALEEQWAAAHERGEFPRSASSLPSHAPGRSNVCLNFNHANISLNYNSNNDRSGHHHRSRTNSELAGGLARYWLKVFVSIVLAVVLMVVVHKFCVWCQLAAEKLAAADKSHKYGYRK